MKIAKMIGTLGKKADEVRGIVQEATLELQEKEWDDWENAAEDGIVYPELCLIIKDELYQIRAMGLPRVDAGEEVILHFMPGKRALVGLQIVNGKQSVFRIKFRYYQTVPFHHDEKQECAYDFR